MKSTRPRGFTLIELLITVSIISMLAGILLPVFVRVRRHTRKMVGMKNQRHIVSALNFFAVDNDEWYPPSVAVIGDSNNWNWQEPIMFTGYRKRSPELHRAISEYLGGYINDPKIMVCPNAPNRYKHLRDVWKAGDDWDYPDPNTSPIIQDPVIGTYCFYWNYIGYLGGRRGVFIGPRGPASGRGQSTILVSDYFGFDHYRSRDAYISCEKFEGSDVMPQSRVTSAYWSSRPGDDIDRGIIKARLHAGYSDGHIESYAPGDTVPMKVSRTANGDEPYPDEFGPGIFYIPRNALH